MKIAVFGLMFYVLIIINFQSCWDGTNGSSILNQLSGSLLEACSSAQRIYYMIRFPSPLHLAPWSFSLPLHHRVPYTRLAPIFYLFQLVSILISGIMTAPHHFVNIIL